MITSVNDWYMQQVKPDITFYLNISVSEAKRRIMITRNTDDKFEQDLINHLEKLVYVFDTIFKTRDNIIILDAMQDPEEMAQKVFKKMIELYQEKVQRKN